MTDSKNLELSEKLMTQLEEMQKDIENLTQTLKTKEEEIGMLQTQLSESISQKKKIEKSMKSITEDADRQCRRMQTRLQQYETEKEEESAKAVREKKILEQKLHSCNTAIAVLLIYSILLTCFSILIIGGF